MRHSRAIARIFVILAVSGLVGVLVFWAADSFWIYQAKRGARLAMLSHQSMRLYVHQVMLPALIALEAKGAIPEELYASEIFSPGYMVREQQRLFNELRRKQGLEPIYYKIASDNPLNPVNRADEREDKLISFFNTHRDQKHYSEIVEQQGKKFMYYVVPFPENTKACLRCHGNRADAPVQLQKRYPGPGGFNEQPGRIRAVELILFPIATEKRWTMGATAMLLTGTLILGGLVLTNRWLSRRVKERTKHLERETAERRKAEEALRITQFAVDVMSDSAYRFAKDGTIVYANESAIRQLGYTREELVGKMNVGDLSDQLTPVRWEDIWKILETKRNHQVETQHRRKDGAQFPVEVCVSYMHFGDGEFAWAVVRDLTWRKQLEARFLEAQKMEAIGTLAGGIAHDFNNILFAVYGFAELAYTSISDDRKERDYIKQIIKASERARELVQQLLDFSRRNHRDKLPIQVGEIAKEALKLLRAVLPTTIEIIDRIDVELWAVADATGFHQIMMNLCTNAFHAMRDTGGVLLVELSRVDAGADDIPPALLPGPCVLLRVRDNGHGMPPETLGRIFEPYFTTRRSAGGTGLGLSVVQSLVTSYGGTVTVQSEVGSGTVFDVWLLAAQASSPIQRADSKDAPEGHERILVLDDEEAVREIVRIMLANLGYNVRSAADPEEAINLLRADPYALDLVVTDQTMPKMTGLCLAARLREISPSVKVVLMSGFSHEIQGHTVSELGVNVILNKPFTARALAAAVREALDAM